MRTQIIQIITAGTSAKLTANIQDESGVSISSANLTTLTLTVYANNNTASIVNSRSNQNILNANNVTVDTSGNLIWQMTPADNTILGNYLSEVHTALFTWTYSSGTKTGKQAIDITVQAI